MIQINIDVSDLQAKDTLIFCNFLQKTQFSEDCTFNFENIHTCDPFPMLIVSSTIRQLRAKNRKFQWVGTNAKNSYAQHMGFFSACGLPIGKLPGEAHGSKNYLPVQSINMKEL